MTTRPPNARRVLLAVVGVAWIAVLVRVVQALLFRQLQDQPLVFTAWLGAALVLGLGTEAVLGAGRTGDRPARTTTSIALLAFLPVLALLFHQAFLGVVSDGRDYYVQVHSLVMDGNVVVTQEKVETFGASGRAFVYPVGTAILWAPFFAACHVWLGFLNVLGADHLRDGYIFPYQAAVGLGSLLYGYLALRLIVRLLCTYVARSVAVWATLTVFGGSFLLWYLTVEPGMSHAASLFSVTVFLFIWHQTQDERTLPQWTALGAAAGLMALVRWQNGLFVLIPALEALGPYWHAWRGTGRATARQLLQRHGYATIAAFVVLLPQFLFWRVNQGGWFTLPSGTFRVNWLEPSPLDVLFSPNHGLLSSTPIIYVALIGLLLFVGRHPRVGLLLSVGFLAQVYANSVLQGWWGGSAFGARRFAGCALIFAIGMASLFEWCRRRPVATGAALVLPIILVNVLLMWDVRAGRLRSGSGLTGPQLLSPAYDRFGNPFSFPASLLFALAHDVSLQRYDAVGERLFDRLALDVGETGDEPYLTYGWSERERQSDLSFRWVVGRTAGLAVPVTERVDHLPRFRAQPFRFANAPGAVVEIVVNGRPLTEMVLAETMEEYTVTIGRAWMQPNLNHIRFRFSRVQSPHALGISDDERELAARFDTIELARAEPRPSIDWSGGATSTAR